MRIYKNELFNKNELIEEEVPNGWSVNKFENICSICRGASPRPINKFLTNSDGIPWIKIGDATKVSKYIKDTNEYITKEAAKKSRYVYDGDLIVSNSATPCLPRFVKKTSCIHDGWLLLRDFKGVDKEFLFYIFTIIKEKLKNQGNGSIFINLSTDILKNFYIKYPSIEEQKRIADVLSKQESIINKTKNLIEQLEKRNTFMLDELLSGRLRIKEENGKMEFYKNPDDNWQTVLMNGNEIKIAKDFKKTSIENNCIWYSSGVALKSKEMLSEGKYPVIKMTDIKNGYIEKDFKVFTNKYVEKALLKRNDIVIGLSGSVGKIGIVKTDNDLILNQRCLAIRVKEYRTLILKILENSFKIWISSKIKAGVIPNISHKEVLDFNFSLPISNNELIYLDNFITSIFSEKERYEELLIEEQKKFDFLLEELMSGRLRIEE